jgi:hypothetical protein
MKISYDQRFKELLTEFLSEFLSLFFPDIAARLDCAAPEFLDKETFTQPREGYRKELDLVVKVRYRDTGESALIHIENQAYRKGMSGKRMFDCNSTLRHRHNQPVWSIVLYLREGVGVVGFLTYGERFAGEVVITFRYGTVNLSRLNVADYRQVDNPLAGGLLPFMQRGPLTAVEHKLVCYQHVAAHARTDVRREMLVDIIDTCLTLSAAEQAEFDRLIRAPENGEMREIVTQWELRGRLWGELHGERKALLEQLRAKFGDVDADVEEQINAISDEKKLIALLRGVLTAQSLADLGLRDGRAAARPPVTA